MAFRIPDLTMLNGNCLIGIYDAGSLSQTPPCNIGLPERGLPAVPTRATGLKRGNAPASDDCTMDEEGVRSGSCLEEVIYDDN